MLCYFGCGSVYALHASDGSQAWATDVDPDPPEPRTVDEQNHYRDAEVESSPVVLTRSYGASVVFVGMDTNENDGVDAGVLAINARTGAVLWKYDAATDRVLTPPPGDDLTSDPRQTWLSQARGNGGCGDVWGSPALDMSGPGHPSLFFGTGNCTDETSTSYNSQKLVAIDATGGRKLWTFTEPVGNHGRDEDFGPTPVLTTVAGERVVVQAGKSGWVYVLDRAAGSLVRQVHVAVGSSIGGFIGSVAVANTGPNNHPVLYGDSAIPVHTDGSIDGSPTDVTKGSSLHAVDLVTGLSLWEQPLQTPSYAPVTVSNGVVFAPDTTQFSVQAYDAATGLPLWHLPVAAATAGGVAVAGDSVVFGAGTFFADHMPPQVTGVWCFRPAAAA